MTINYSLYPFLPYSLSEHITDFKDQFIQIAYKNIEFYKPSNIESLDREVFLISVLMVRKVDSGILLKKFVTNYGKSFEHYFKSDIYKSEYRDHILPYLNLPTNSLSFDRIGKERFVKLHMLDYLELSTIIDDNYPKFKLVNTILEKGIAHIPMNDFLYLCRLVIEDKLYKKIKSLKVYNDNKLINSLCTELEKKYPKYIKKRSTGTTMNASIKSLIEKAYSEHHLQHHERIKLGIYLQSYGYDEEYILDIFRQLSDFNLKITTYQLRSLKRYIK